MATRIEPSDHEIRVLIGGRFGVSDCTEARETMIEALSLERPVRLDLANLGEADVSLIQLLLCARASARARDLELTVNHHGYAFKQTLTRCGFEHLLEEAWIDGEEVQYFIFDGVG